MRKFYSIKLLLCALLLAIGCNAWGETTWPVALPDGGVDFASYKSWTGTKTKDVVIYDDNYYLMAVTKGNNLATESNGLKVGSSNAGACFYFYLDNDATVSVVIKNNGSNSSNITVSLYSCGTTKPTTNSSSYSSTTNMTLVASTAVSSTTTSGTITPTSSLKAGYYKIVATKRYFLNAINVTYATVTPVGSPTNLNPGTPSATEATLSWDAVEHATAYKVEYKISTASSWTAVSPNPTTTSCTISGLTASTTYAWQVTALSTETGYKDGSAQAGPNFTTAAPANHKAYFSINGTIQNPEGTEFLEGNAIEFPSVGDQGDKKFMGWTETSNYTGVDAPTDLCTSATMGGDDATYYAVYATVGGSGVDSWVEIFTAPEAGTYAICSNSYFMKASISNNRFQNDDSTTPQIADGKLTTAPADNCQWVFSNPDTYYRIQNGDNYAGGTSSNNQGALITNSSDDKAKWTISYDVNNSMFVIENYGRANSDNRFLRNNDTYGWATYTSGTGEAPRLFKLTSGTTYSDYTTTVKAVDHIKVTTAPQKVLYKVGESLDVDDMVVTAYFDAEENDSQIISAGYTVTPDAALTTADKNITVTLNADNTKTTTTPIDVVALDKIVAAGAKNTYFETQDFDPAGLVVTATWGTEEGKKIEEDVTAYVTITGDKNLQHTANFVQISYTHECTTKTFDYAITVSQSSENALTRLTMSNGFKPFITSKNLVAYYIQGSEVPTINESSIAVSPYATKRVEGNRIIVTAQDGTEATYTVTTTEVAPLTTSTNAATTFDGSESAWIKSGYGWSADKGWKISKNLDSKDLTDESRIIQGKNRLYFYIGPALEFKLINGLIGTNRDVIVTVNGEVQSDLDKIIANSKDNGPSVMTLTGLSNQTNNVICIESNNNGGDGGFSAYELTIAPRYTVSFKYTDGNEAHKDICQETYNANITLPDLTVAEGKLFKGWSTSAEPTSADAGVAGATYKPMANTPLYAYIVDVYAVTFNGTVEHGSFEVKNGATTITSGDKIEVGTELTVVCNNEAHYHVASVAYNGTPIPYDNNKYSFIVPAEAVEVSVVFKEDKKFEVSWMVNGFETKKENLYADVHVSAPVVSAQGNKEFMGWVESPIAEATDTKPDMVDVSGLTVSESKTFYAVFATKSGTSSTEEFTMSATSVTQNGITIAAAKANGTSDPAYTSGELRIYASNTITISSDDYITAFSLTFHKQGSKGYIESITANEGGYVSGGVSTSGDDDKVDTWSGSSKSITLTAGSSGQRVFVSASVTVGSTTYSDYCTSITSCEITLTYPEGGDYGFSTFCGSANYTVVGAKAYKAKVKDGELVLTELTGVIPAGNSEFENGVVIAGTPKTATIRYTSEDANADMTGNQLLGTLAVTPAADLKGNATYLMVFSKSKGGFVSYTGTDVPAYKACLPYNSPVPVGGGAPMRMVFGRDNLPTNNVNVNVNDNQGTKVMIDGRLYILRDGKTYDSFGRLVK